LTFPAPAYSTSETADWTDPRTLPDLQQLFSKILRPSDVTSQHYDTFNIEILPACSVEDLVPPIRNGTSYSPPLDAAQDTPKASYADASKSDPVVAGQRNDYAERLAELAIDNDTVFRTLTRTVKGGVKPPRLAYMRKFYEGLESMSPYWDCSLDQYYEVDDDSVPEDAGKNHKRQRLDPGTTESSVESFSYSSEHVTTSGSSSSMSKEATSEGDSQPDRADEACTSESAAENRATEEERAKKSPSASPEPPPRTRYKGRRTSNGRGMPDQFRAGTVRAFVEGTVWPFQCSLTAPRHMPLLQLGKLNLPVRQTAAVYRLPKDRMTARQGRLEGPIVGLQVRSEIGFVEADGRVAVAKSRLDSLREIGGLLQLAQQRRRAGRKLEKPGEGQWWTTKARWGGGLGGEVESENGDIAQAAEELLNDMKERRGKDGGKGRRKKTPALLWKELKCGNGNWDPKVRTHIRLTGRVPPGEAYDGISAD